MKDVIAVDDTTVTNVGTMTDNIIEAVQGRNKGFEADKTGHVIRPINITPSETDQLFFQKYKGKRKILGNSTRLTSSPVNPQFSPVTVKDVTAVKDTTVTNVVTMTDNTIETVQGRNKGFEVDKAENVIRSIHTIPLKSETEMGQLKLWEVELSEEKNSGIEMLEVELSETKSITEEKLLEVELLEEQTSEIKNPRLWLGFFIQTLSA